MKSKGVDEIEGTLKSLSGVDWGGMRRPSVMEMEALGVSYLSVGYWVGLAIICLAILLPIARTAARRKLTTRRN